MDEVDYPEIVKGAIDRTRKGWCKFELFGDKNCYPVDPTSPEAVNFCLLGSLTASTYEYFGVIGEFHLPTEEQKKVIADLAFDLMNAIPLTTDEEKYSYKKSITEWNDYHRTKKEDVIWELKNLYQRVKRRGIRYPQ